MYGSRESAELEITSQSESRNRAQMEDLDWGALSSSKDNWVEERKTMFVETRPPSGRSNETVIINVNLENGRCHASLSPKHKWGNSKSMRSHYVINPKRTPESKKIKTKSFMSRPSDWKKAASSFSSPPNELMKTMPSDEQSITSKSKKLIKRSKKQNGTEVKKFDSS